MGALKSEVRKLCKSFGLENIEVTFADDRKEIKIKGIDILVDTEIDPTEESNAVCWGDN